MSMADIAECVEERDKYHAGRVEDSFQAKRPRIPTKRVGKGNVRMPASANIIDGSVQREVDGFIRICTIVFK